MNYKKKIQGIYFKFNNIGQEVGLPPYMLLCKKSEYPISELVKLQAKKVSISMPRQTENHVNIKLYKPII